MQTKKFRKLLSSLTAAAMLASSGAAVMPMSAAASELTLIDSDFEDGIGLPWHTVESEPARQSFEIKDGKYTIHIINNEGSGGRWDLQFRHKGLSLIGGHEYKLSGTITSNADGYIYSEISNYSSEKSYWHNLGGQEWAPYKISKDESYEFEDTFKMPEDCSPAQWTFQYADNLGMYNNDDTGMPQGSIITFDNLKLIDLDNDACIEYTASEYGAVRPRSNVRINQMGYYTDLDKRATYCTDNQLPCEFELRDEEGKVVYKNKAVSVSEDTESGTGKTSTGNFNVERVKDSGKYVQILDFSDFKTPGKYTIFVKDDVGVSDTAWYGIEGAFDTKLKDDKLMWNNPWLDQDFCMNESYAFNIGDEIYKDDLLGNAINYFYQNRSSCDIVSDYITSGDKSALAHRAGNKNDVGYVQPEWVKYYDTSSFDGDKTYQLDVTGGWYDAEYHAKSVINGGFAVWMLQNTYELSKLIGTAEKFNDGKIPMTEEINNKYPDILDEARYELEWMMNMIVSEDDPHWGESCKDFVYHKVQDHKYIGLAVKPWDYAKQNNVTRIVKPPTYAATLNFVACAAQASRLWKGIDDEFADKCLELAKKSYDAVSAKKDKFIDVADGDSKRDPQFAPLDQAIGSDAYGDAYVADEYYWAGCELFAATGDSKYYENIKNYKNVNDVLNNDKAFNVPHLLASMDHQGSIASFSMENTSGLGTLSLFLNQDDLENDDRDMINKSIIDAADYYSDWMHNESNGMGLPYHSLEFTDISGLDYNSEIAYDYGSNALITGNALVLAYAYEATGDKKYLSDSAGAMDYIFGRNGNGFSYVTGCGEYRVQNPTHRYWANEVNPEYPKAPDGVLVGGPSPAIDNYVASLGLSRHKFAPQKNYADSVEAWSVNCPALQYNAPLAAVASIIKDAESGADIANDRIPQPAAKEKVKIQINSTPQKSEYKIGEELDLTGAIASIYGTNTDGTKWETLNQPVDSEHFKVDASEFDSSKPGKYKIYISPANYPNIKAEITVQVDSNTTSTTTSTTTTSTTTTSSTSTTSSTTVLGEKPKYGDANCDTKINLADAVLIMQSIANPSQYGAEGTSPDRLTAAGKKNADCANPGDGVTNLDALAIQKYALKLIPSLPEYVAPK